MRNTLPKYVRAERMGLDDAVRASAFAAVLVRRTTDMDDADVLRTASRLGLTAYDAEYVVLARVLGVRLVSSDRRVLAAVPDVAVSPDAFLALGPS